MIVVTSVSKHFGTVVALDNVSLEVYDGEIVAVIGSNGAGKSTLVSMFTGIYPPTRGKISIYGLDTWKDRKMIWNFVEYLSMNEKLIPSYSAYENAQLFSPKSSAGLVKIRTDRILGEGNLFLKPTDRGRPIINLSKGMRQKTYIASMEDLPIVIVDEPAEGLDPNMMNNLREYILRQKKTVVWITHNMKDADAVSRVFVLVDAKMAGWGKPEVLKRWLNARDMEDVLAQLTRPAKNPILSSKLMEPVSCHEMSIDQCYIDDEAFHDVPEVSIGLLNPKVFKRSPQLMKEKIPHMPKIYLNPGQYEKLSIDSGHPSTRCVCWKTR